MQHLDYNLILDFKHRLKLILLHVKPHMTTWCLCESTNKA